MVRLTALTLALRRMSEQCCGAPDESDTCSDRSLVERVSIVRPRCIQFSAKLQGMNSCRP